MRRLRAVVELADVLVLMGAVLVGITIYLLWPVFVPAYAGLVLVGVGILRAIGASMKAPDGQ